MKASVKFTKTIDKVPSSCRECPFVDICAEAIHGITKRGGMEYTTSAMKRRHKSCPLVIEQ